MDEIILGIDGTGSTAEAALVHVGFDGAARLLGRNSAPGAAESLIKLIEELLSAAGRPRVSKIAVLVGPGSFTGIRSSAATALGLAGAWGARTVLVPFLRAALITELDDRRAAAVAPYLKANRNETFCGAYHLRRRGDGIDPRAWTAEELLAPREFATADFEAAMRRLLAERGLAQEVRFFEAPQGDGCAERAALAAMDGSFGAAAEPGELYLKPVQAKTLRERGVFQPR